MDHFDAIWQRLLRLLPVFLILVSECSGQFYGRLMPCPVSYVDPDGDCVPGIAGKDYPMLPSVPRTSFRCSDHPVKFLGYFADPEAMCQVFHVCLSNGHQETFLCPNGTLFNQQFLLCDWWFHVQCSEAPKLYEINEYLQPPLTNFRPGPIHPNWMPIPSENLGSSSNSSPNANVDPKNDSDGVITQQPQETTVATRPWAVLQRAPHPSLRPVALPLGPFQEPPSGRPSLEPLIRPRIDDNETTSAPSVEGTKDWAFKADDSALGPQNPAGLSAFIGPGVVLPQATPNEDTSASTSSPLNERPPVGLPPIQSTFSQWPSSQLAENFGMPIGLPRK